MKNELHLKNDSPPTHFREWSLSPNNSQSTFLFISFLVINFQSLYQTLCQWILLFVQLPSTILGSSWKWIWWWTKLPIDQDDLLSFVMVRRRNHRKKLRKVEFRLSLRLSVGCRRSWIHFQFYCLYFPFRSLVNCGTNSRFTV